MTDQITLVVDGAEYTGWIQAEVERSLDQFAHRFDLTYVDKWSDFVDPWPIRPGNSVVVKYGDHVLVTGHVDFTSFTASSDSSWKLRAAGRSLTGDLVDSSAIHKSGSWQNAKLSTIANDLVRPYGLSVLLSVPDNDPIPKFALQEGETVYDALDRLVRNRGFLLFTHPDGNVGLIRLLDFIGVVADAPVAQALSRELEEDQQQVHNQYFLRSQSFTSDDTGADISIRRKFDGPAVTGMRYRPLVIFADAASDRAQLEKRALWEQSVRYGRSLRVRYTFPGVLDPNGFPWAPGNHYHVRDQALGVEETLLCCAARLHVTAEDLTTDVEFTRPEAFSLLEWPDDILNLVTKRGRPRVKQARVRDQQRG